MKKIILLLVIGVSLSAQSQSIQLNFDFSNAEQTLAWINNPASGKGALNRLMALPSTHALQKKLRIDSITLQQALISVHDTGLYKPAYARLGYPIIKSRAAELEKFIRRIKSREDSLRTEVEKAMSGYLPPGKALSVTIRFLLGGNSSGFTMGDDSIFYVGLQQYKSDLAGIGETFKHELFHNIQRLYRPHFVYSDELDKAGKTGLAYVHFMLVHLFQEGSAEYVVDLRKNMDPGALYLRELKGHALVNDYRSADVFYLISKLLTESSQFPDQTEQGRLYSVLFDWNWNNPGYYAGYIMTKALVTEYGDKILTTYLAKDPSEFVYDYIQLTKRFPEKYPLAFTDEFAAVVNELRSAVKQITLQ